MPHETFLKSIELLGKKVLPKVRQQTETAVADASKQLSEIAARMSQLLAALTLARHLARHRFGVERRIASS